MRKKKQSATPNGNKWKQPEENGNVSRETLKIIFGFSHFLTLYCRKKKSDGI
jgi:hypothetical protein